MLALPVLVGSAALIFGALRHAPWIAHRRVGWQGPPLWMLKLRTMWGRGIATRQAGSNTSTIAVGPSHKRAGDPRVSHRFASFCRRHSIDELPQLWHVIIGRDVAGGAASYDPRELRRYYGEDAEEILQVKPGIAGLWQISGRNRLTYAERGGWT